MLQIDVGVNQPDPIAIVSGYPYLTVYADGRVIARNRSVESGALPPLVVARITQDGVRALVQEAIDRGALTPLDRYGSPAVADADGTRFVVATADIRSEFGVYALGERAEPDNEYNDVTPEQQAARDELASLRRSLLGWETTVADDVIEPPTLFLGDSMLVVAYSEFDVQRAGWSVDVSGGDYYETRIDSLWCTEVVVADNPDLVDEVTSSGFDPDFVFRQVLPHEPGCQILPDQ